MQNIKTNFFFLRLPIAVSFLGHGLVRLPKLAMFSQWMVSSMEKSFLPSGLILAWSYLLPVLEFLTGILLLVGFKFRYISYAGLSIMAILIFGSASVENWGAIEAQLIHAVYLFGLLWYYEKNVSTVNS